MTAAIVAWTHALVLFALIGEADTLWLQIVAGALAVLFAASGSMSAWQAARK